MLVALYLYMTPGHPCPDPEPVPALAALLELRKPEAYRPFRPPFLDLMKSANARSRFRKASWYAPFQPDASSTPGRSAGPLRGEADPDARGPRGVYRGEYVCPGSSGISRPRRPATLMFSRVEAVRRPELAVTMCDRPGSGPQQCRIVAVAWVSVPLTGEVGEARLELAPSAPGRPPAATSRSGHRSQAGHPRRCAQTRAAVTGQGASARCRGRRPGPGRSGPRRPRRPGRRPRPRPGRPRSASGRAPSGPRPAGPGAWCRSAG